MQKSRAIFIAVMTVALALLSLYNAVFNRGASFKLETEKPGDEIQLTTSAPLSGIDEPEDSYQLVRLTFGGSCTPASMLGSTSYGTFNAMKNEMGEEYFLSRIADIFKNDDLTVIGCNAVLSDSTELSPNSDGTEWYLAPADSVEIFTSSGVDAISLECSRNMDYGWTGYAELKSAVSGTELLLGDSARAIYKSIGEIDVAVYCCMLDTDDQAVITSWVENAAEKNDFVVLYVSDRESAEAPTESTISLCRAYIDAGANLIVGTNEANLQYAEQYGDGYIVYSLGALIDGTMKYPEKYTALLSVELKANGGEIHDICYSFIPLATYDESHSWQPSVLEDGDEKNAVLDRLTKK